MNLPRTVSLIWFVLSVSVLTSSQTGRPASIEDFATKLVAAKSEQQRATLLATQKDLVDIQLRRVLIQKGNTLLASGQYAGAFDVYTIAKVVAEQIGDQEGVATATLDLGTVYYLQAKNKSALENYQKARELFVKVRNNYEAAKALSGVALIDKEQGRKDEALKLFTQVLKEFEALNDKEEMANTLSSIGTIYYEQRKYAEASSAFLKSTELNSNADNIIRIADAFYMQGDYGEAANYYRKSLASFEQQNDPAGIISALTGAANSDYYQGNYGEALDYFERNLRVQELEHDQQGLASSLRGIGNVYRARGDFGSALESYEQSLDIAQKIKAPLGTTLGSIGLVRAFQGENAMALEFYTRALAEFEQADNKIDEARVLSLIGNVNYAEGQDESALDFYRRSLALREEMDDKPGTADLLVGIGTVQLRRKAYADALESYQKALKVFEGINHKQGAANTLSRIADTYLQESNYTQALNFSRLASSMAKQIDSSDVLWYALLLSGKAQRGLELPAQSLQSFIEAIAIVESLRLRPAASEAGADHSGVLPYLAAADLLIQQNRPNEAFTYCERAKVQSLVELLRRGNAQSVKGMSAVEQRDENKLSGDAVALELQLERDSALPTSDEKRREAVRSRLNQARAQYAAIRKRLYLAHPSLKVERGELATPKVEQLLPLVNDRRTAVLEYAIAENNVYLFVLTADNAAAVNTRSKSKPATAMVLNAYPLPIKPATLAQQVRLLYRLLSTRDDTFHPLARELYDALIRPAEEQVAGKTRIVIIPDAILWRLPFESLESGDDHYLLDQAAVSYAPSISALREMANQRRPPRRAGAVALSAFANPQLSDNLSQRIERTYKTEKLMPSAAEEEEVKQLASVYGAVKRNTFLGPLASEERARLEATQADILHFAAPAILDDISPMYSFVALSSSPGDKAADGLLQAREIINLKTAAQLVVLSGSRDRSDGFNSGGAATGWAWSWFVAGCPATLLTRWSVESPSKAQLMSEFHSRLRSKSLKSKASALQQSAEAIRHLPDYRHPYYWVSYALIGDAR